MHFDHPWALLLLLPALAAAWRLRTALAWRAAIAATTLLAAAGPRLGPPTAAGLTRIYVLDASASAGGGVEALALAKLDARDLAGNDRAGVVVVGEVARVELPPGAPDALHRLAAFASRAGPHATRLGEGIEAAAALVPPGAAGEIVLISDGRDTSGGAALPASAAARRRGIAIRAVPCGSDRLADARVDRVEVPARVRAGERFEAVVVVSASAPLRVRVAVGDRSRELQLDPGVQARVAFPQDPATEALTWVAATVESLNAPDVLPANNRAEAPVLLDGRIPVLVLTPASPSPAATLLRADPRFSVVESAGLDDLALFAAVVLDSIPAEQLGDAGARRVAQFVADGGGLLALGGPDGLGAGGYGATPLDPVLPVDTSPQDALTLVVLLDASGSMNDDAAPGRTKLREAQEALRALARSARPGTTLAFAAFSGSARWIAPPSTDLAPLLRALESLDAGGATAILPALELASTALGAGRTHVVLVSDGATAERPDALAAAAARLSAAGATVTAVAGGADAKTATLEAIAPGRVVLMKDFTELQRTLREDLARLQGLTAAGTFDAGDGRVALQVNLCRARDGAEIAGSAGPHLLAATRPHGRGRAAVLATSPRADWVRDPGRWTSLLSDLARAVARPDAGGRLTLAVDGDDLVASWTPAGPSADPAVAAELTLPDGATRPLTLLRTARDRFTARTRHPAAGRFVLSAARTRAAAARPWPPEYAATGPRPDLLAPLAGPAAAPPPPAPAGHPLAPWLLVAAVALTVAAAAASLRSPAPPPKLAPVLPT